MYKDPLSYKEDELSEIMNRPMHLEIGKPYDKKVEETLEGEIIECFLAANPPYRPAAITFKQINGNKRKIHLFEIIRFF